MDLKAGFFLATLCLLIRDGMICLGVKKCKIGKGMINSGGGGVDPGEDIAEACAREAFEELGVTIVPKDLQPVAIVRFVNMTPAEGICEVEMHIFATTEFAGEPTESDEIGDLEWYQFNDVPYHQMMPADREWLPQVLAGFNLVGTYYYNANQTALVQPSRVTLLKPLQY